MTKGGSKILALVSDAFGGRGGIAQYNRDFLGALAAEQGVASIHILPRHAPDAFAVPEKIHQTARAASRLSFVFRALATALTHKADIVFCGHINLAPLAALVARLSGARLMVQLHGFEAWDRPGRWHRRAVEAADLVLCVSRYTRARFLQWAAVEPDSVVVLPNTVSSIFVPGDGSALRKTWGLEGKRILLTVGRMDKAERYKGQDRVIKAIPALVRDGHDVIYVILGDGNDQARLEDAAREAGVSDRVLFVGAVGRETLISAYRMADLFVMPSTGEGFGIVFLEAMASGTPALGLAAGGTPDPMVDGQLGYVVSEAELPVAISGIFAGPAPNPDALSAAVFSHFGRSKFSQGVRAALGHLVEAS